MRIASDILDKRRSCIRSYYYQGLKEVDIIRKLEDAGFFPETKQWSQKRYTVLRDIQLIKRADEERFKAVEFDASRAYRDYIARQETIYRRAIERNDLDVALRASKDIAKANGVETDEVNRPKEDLHTIMMRLKQKTIEAPRTSLNAPVDAQIIPSFVPMNGKPS